MRNTINRILAVAALLVAGSNVIAQPVDQGWYYGIGLGGSTFSGDIAGQIGRAYADNAHYALVGARLTDEGDVVKQATVGYRFTSWFGIEGGWQDLGSARGFYSIRAVSGPILSPGPSSLDSTWRARDLHAAAILAYPIGDRLELLARGGVAWVRLNYQESGIAVNGRPYSFRAPADDSARPLLGVGAAWTLSPAWSVRLDFDRTFDVGKRFALNADTNGRFDHIDAWTINLFWKP